MTTVVGTFTDPQHPSQPASGTVWFTLAATVSHEDPSRLVTRSQVPAQLDDAGAFTVDLVPSDDPGWDADGPVPYTVRIAVSGHYGTYSVLVPDSATPVDLRTLIDLGAPPDVVPVPVPGPPGPPPVLVDGTTETLPPGSPATHDVVPTGTPGEYRVDMGIPEGLPGVGVPEGGAAGQVLTKVGSQDYATGWADASEGGTTDHGALEGLGDPDHPISAVQGLQDALDGKATIQSETPEPDAGYGVAFRDPDGRVVAVQPGGIVAETAGDGFRISTDTGPVYLAPGDGSPVIAGGGLQVAGPLEALFPIETPGIGADGASELGLTSGVNASGHAIRGTPAPSDVDHLTRRDYVDSRWASPWHIPVVSGRYSATAIGNVTGIRQEATEYPSLIVPHKNGTIDRLAVHVTVVGTTGAAVRLGVRAWDPATGLPGALILDAGTVTATTTFIREVTVNLPVVAGVPLILTATLQGAAGTRPTLTCHGSALPVVTTTTNSYANPLWIGGTTATTGALPTSQTWTITDSPTVRVWARFA